jgi:hypothetical protein
MPSLFKRFKKKIPVSTGKSSPYYERANLILSPEDLKRILMGAPDIKGYKTSKGLTFNNIPLLDITPSVLKKKFDNPAHVLKRSSIIPGHKVIFYKDSVALYKFLIQYHFFNDRFFFASNRISSMAVLTEKEKARIIKRISDKYLEGIDAGNIDPILKVTDPNGSIIYTIDDVYFHLNYLPGNDTRKELLDKYNDFKELSERPRGLSESLEKYI